MARTGLFRHRKFKRLARALERIVGWGGEVAAAGVLELLWQSGYDAACEVVGDDMDVEAACHWRGDPGVLTPLLLEAGGGDGRSGFIEPTPDDPTRYQIHDFWVHAPKFVSQKANDEARREERGESISEARARAGRAGAAKRWSASQKQTMLPLDEQPQLSDPEPIVANAMTGANEKWQSGWQKPAVGEGRVGEGRVIAAGEPAGPPTPDQRQPKKKNEKQIPFTIREALVILGTCQRIVLPDLKGDNGKKRIGQLARIIRICKEVEPLKVIVEWINAGGGFPRDLDLDRLTSQVDTWMAMAKAWDAGGRKPLEHGRSQTQRSGLGGEDLKDYDGDKDA